MTNAETYKLFMVVHGLATFTDQDFLMNEEHEMSQNRLAESSGRRVNESIKKKARKRDLTTK